MLLISIQHQSVFKSITMIINSKQLDCLNISLLFESNIADFKSTPIYFQIDTNDN